ncbi:DUF4129 domain-containing protein [Streptomyces sp. NPDC096136]|uniref:DUF4129 domain-containing protein n=1 Tax=Streptomyces sp. NPDC096136 TaxID=3366076 RepID=UPI0037F4B3D2
MGTTALAALLLRPGAGLFAEGRGPLGGNPVLVLGLALLSLLCGIALRVRYREQVGPHLTLGPVEQRLADGVGRVLLAVPLVVPLLIVVLHRFGASGGGSRGVPEASPPPLPGQDPPTAPPSAPPRAAPGEQGAHLGLTRVLLGLGIALLAVALVCAALRLWRHLTRPAVPGPPATYATPAGGQDHLVRAVDSGRSALLDAADARTAVIACYLAMEESLAGSGVARHASDSPQDLLERALDGGLPAGTAAAELTALFREARYSTHPMHDGHRDRAAAALGEIAHGLRPQAHGAGAGAG